MNSEAAIKPSHFNETCVPRHQREHGPDGRYQKRYAGNDQGKPWK
jgi:hypothetical protein